MDNIPMRPPKLPGYDFVQMLGSGATATVYLYNQRMPARPVFWVISVSPPMCMTAPKPDSRRRGHRLRCFSI